MRTDGQLLKPNPIKLIKSTQKVLTGDFIERAKKIEVLRFIVGLTLVAYPFLALLWCRVSMDIIPIAIVGTPLLYGIIPLAVAGIYFMAVSRIRWKADTVAAILAVIGVLISTNVVLGFNVGGGGIGGPISFQVKILYDNGSPAAGVEVDIAETPGPPPEGGIAITDENGVARFNLRAGEYYIYFNTANFPTEYHQPDPIKATVTEGGTNYREIVLIRK